MSRNPRQQIGTPDAVPVLERSRLGALTKIASGGQGVVYLAPGVRLGFSSGAAFKEYKSGNTAQFDAHQLAAMPRFLTSQPAPTAMHLVGITAWPCATVQDAGRVVGFVMPVIPDRFFTEIVAVRGVRRTSAEFQHLLNSREVVAQRGIMLSDGDRYRLIAALASELAFLHSLGIAVGDMSPKNMMFSLRPNPAVYFIDTDAMRVAGRSVSAQMESPGWAAPPGEELATRYSDRYKLGLLVLRLLVGDQTVSSPSHLPPGVPGPIANLVHRALSSPPTTRPAPSDWVPKAQAAAYTADAWA